jgi:arabinogalactan oligomer/maltooligosaccharide transport system substrate-binding protein
MTDSQKAAFLPKSIEGVTFNSQVYGVPYALENVALYRNTTMAPNAPTSIEDMVTTGEALKAAGTASEILVLPVGQNGDAYHMYPFFTSGGGSVFGKTPDGAYDPKQLELGTPEAAAAMTKIAALGETGSGVIKRSIDSAQVPTLFTDGKAPYMISGPWNLPAVQKSGVPYAISPVPGFEGAAPASPFIGVQAMYIAAKGKNKAVAQEYATNYFATPEVAKALFEAQPRPPALKAVYEEVAATNADIKAFVEAGTDGQIMPSITAMAATFAPWGKAQAAIVGGADPTQTMTDTANAIKAQIGG